MLVRRKIDLTKQEWPNDRHAWPDYHICRQDVTIDPWESDDCAKVIGEAFSVGPIGLVGWSSVAGSSPVFSNGEQLVRICEDRETGYIYYRRPVDITRSQMWNEDRTFRVTAAEW
jgi:hypothetical protein